MTEALIDWTGVFAVNAAWQIPVIAAAAFAALRIVRRPHPETEYVVWMGALVASVAVPAWATSGLAGGGASQVSADAPWIAAELLAFTFLGSVAIAVGLFLRSWNYVRVLKRLPVVAEPSKTLLRRVGCCANSLGIPTPEVRICDVPSPATVGSRHPMVLLPRSVATEPEEAILDAAIAHEVAHISRQDYRSNFWLELLSAVVAAHPVTYWIKGRLKVSREKACDALVAERILNSRDYARSIMTLVSSLGAKAPVRLAPGIFDAGNLTSRIRALLDRRARATMMANRCGLALAVAAFLLTGLFSAQWIRPRMPDLPVRFAPRPPPPPPPPSISTTRATLNP